MADRAFSRAAGAPLVGGNQVQLLEDGRENYPRWLDAIRSARSHIHFESYFFLDDDTGQEFARALMAKAGEGVRVRMIYDWLGGLGKTSRRYWRRLRAGGVEVRAFNPPQLANPLGWISRDHRKLLLVDDEVAFIGGLCVGNMWVGNPSRNIEPWRDTAIEIRGSAIAEIAAAFVRMWSVVGGQPIPGGASTAPRPAGDVCLRIVSSEPSTAGLLRLDQMVAALARRKLWLADAYYAGTTAYVQALRAAAQDDVDVRLLVPNATDLPIIRPLSRAGYRPLLEAGVRIFEWNGRMMHAKTAVADGRWARIGSTNLNLASWLGNWELDCVVEDEAVGLEMEQMYLRDLERATEVVLDQRSRARAPGEPRPRVAGVGRTGSTHRATAGALRIGREIGATIMNRRVLGPVEARLAFVVGLALCALAVGVAVFPRALAYPAAVLCLWGGIALLFRSFQLRRARSRVVAKRTRPGLTEERDLTPR